MTCVCMKVYIRRAYTAYELSCVQHDELESGICVVDFMFLLPHTHPDRYMICFGIVHYGPSLHLTVIL